MNEDLGLKVWPLSQDLLNRESLRALDKQKWFGIGPALNSDDFTNGSVSEQILFPCLTGVNRVIFLLSL
jgi:hypothetical protein